MKPTHYMNLRVATQATSRGPSGASIEVLALLLRAVHGIAKKLDIVFASAFPQARTGERSHPGTVLRVFAGSRDHCDAIAEALEENTMLNGYVIVRRVRPVPEATEGSVTYPRFRTATKKHASPERRAKRLAKGDLLPHLKCRSSSNGNHFSIRFDTGRGKGEPSLECFPDGYGFSVADRAFSLPFIHDDVAPWIPRVDAEAVSIQG